MFTFVRYGLLAVAQKLAFDDLLFPAVFCCCNSALFGRIIATCSFCCCFDAICKRKLGIESGETRKKNSRRMKKGSTGRLGTW